MAKINLPKEMLQKDVFKTLPAKEKEEYLNNMLNKILQINPEGVTISQVREATGLSSSTIWHHLEILKSTSLIRKISRGNIDVYYPLGSIIHVKDFDRGKVRYSLSSVENNEGSFVCIHEKRENSIGSQTTLRGIAIPLELIEDLMLILRKVKAHKKSKK